MKQRTTGRWKWAIAGTGALALALCAGCETRVHSAPARPAPAVVTATVIQKDVPVYGNWIGTLQGYSNEQIKPQVTGYLIRQDYHEGGLVRKNQVLFEIDPRPFQAALDQATAQLAAAQAQLARTTLDVNRDIPEAKAQAIPQSQLDNDRQAQLAARASVEAAKAAVEQAQINLGYTKVRTLIPGIAGITDVQVGNLVGPTTTLTSVSDVSPIKVYFPISEQEYLRIAGRIAPGAVALLSRSASIPLTLILADGSTYPYRGRILFADRQVDAATGTIQIVGSFPNPRDLLRPGEYARVQALTEVLKNALLVPQSAVTQLQGSYQVVVVSPKNHAHIRTIQVGETSGTMWVVSSGLQPGERVISQGAQKVREGEEVRPVTGQPAGAR